MRQPFRRAAGALFLAALALPGAAAVQDATACKYVEFASVPLRYTGPHLEITMTGSINGTPALMLVDTGAGDTVLTRFMNALMYDGKKSAAEGIVYGALEVIERKAKADAVKLFHEALENVKPAVEVRSRRVGGAT